MRYLVLCVLVPSLALAAACGGDTPSAPSKVPPPAFTISGAAGTLALGSSRQLSVTPTCATVEWMSSAPAIVSVRPDGTATAQSPGEADISVMCGGTSVAVHVRVSTLREVSITADQITPVRVGATERLTSHALSGTPARWIDCVASSWESSRPDVASIAFSGITATLTARAAGQTTVTATCDGVNASTTVDVTAGWTVNVGMSEVPPVSMSIVGTVEVLTGPHAGTRVQAMPVGFARLLDMEVPFRVRLSADEYETAEFDVTSGNVTFHPQYNTAEVHLGMKPLPPPPGTDEFVVRLGARESGHWNFQLRGAGSFSALVRFELDYNDTLNVELRCDDRLLVSRVVYGGRSLPVTATVPGACAGEVKIMPSIRYPDVVLRLRVTYPH